jgi:hypothetical protein
MKRVFCSTFICLLFSFSAQAATINIEFTLQDMLYYDYVADEEIYFPDGFPNSAFLSFEIDDYHSLEEYPDQNHISVYFDDASISGTKIVSPIISEFTSPINMDPYSDFFTERPNFRDPVSFSRSETQGAYGNFRESFLAYVAVAGYFDNGFLYSTYTSLSANYYHEGMQDEPSYPLIGSSLINYFYFLQSNNVGFDFGDDYHLWDPVNEIYYEGIGSYGYAYISNISFDNDAVITPEPGTALLLGMGVLGLAGMGRLRRK